MKKLLFCVVVGWITMVSLASLYVARQRSSEAAHVRSAILQDLMLISNYISAGKGDPSFLDWFCHSKDITSKELFQHLMTNAYVGDLVFQRDAWRQLEDFVSMRGDPVQLDRESNHEKLFYRIRTSDPTGKYSSLSFSNEIVGCNRAKRP